MDIVMLIVWCLGAYLLGSLSFAVIVSKMMDMPDPRTYGSGNPGATNVLRSGKKSAAIFTLMGDCLKGVVAVLLAVYAQSRVEVVAGVTVCVFLGHLWPIFFKFKGGKGVATAAGVLLALNIWLGLSVVAVWLFLAFTLRYSSLAALVAALSAILLAWICFKWTILFVAVLVLALLLIWSHRTNIQRLLAGQESKIGRKHSA